jgi:hypothetical protein
MNTNSATISQEQRARQDSFDNLQLAGTSPGVEGSDSKATNSEGTFKKPRFDSHQEQLLSADAEIQKLLKLLSIEQRQKMSLSCDRTKCLTDSSVGVLPPPMKFCRKAKSPVPVQTPCN